MGSDINLQVQVKCDVGDIATITPVTLKITIDQYREIEATIIHVELKRPLTVEDLPKLVLALNKIKKWIANELIILSGRMPVYAFLAMAHALHGFAQAIAVFDPKLNGAIVVASHNYKIAEYSIVKLPEDVMDKIVQLSPP